MALYKVLNVNYTNAVPRAANRGSFNVHLLLCGADVMRDPSRMVCLSQATEN
jgi:hypothetical protein